MARFAAAADDDDATYAVAVGAYSAHRAGSRQALLGGEAGAVAAVFGHASRIRESNNRKKAQNSLLTIIFANIRANCENDAENQKAKDDQLVHLCEFEIKVREKSCGLLHFRHLPNVLQIFRNSILGTKRSLRNPVAIFKHLRNGENFFNAIETITKKVTVN